LTPFRFDSIRFDSRGLEGKGGGPAPRFEARFRSTWNSKNNPFPAGHRDGKKKKKKNKQDCTVL